MQTRFAAVAVVILLALSIPAGAIDRDAAQIHEIGVRAGRNNGDALIEGSALGEVALEDADWAILAGGSYGELAILGLDDTSWEAVLGFKYYLSELTSVSAFGRYGQPVDDDLADAFYGVTGALKRRLAPATENISPFLSAAATYQAVDVVHDDSPDRMIFEGRVGIDFKANEDLVFVLDAGYGGSVGLSDADAIDSVGCLSLGFFMKYYWPD